MIDSNAPMYYVMATYYGHVYVMLTEWFYLKNYEYSKM